MSEPGLDEKHLNKCGHFACKCMVQPSSHFCSEYCARASTAQISGTLPGERSEQGRCDCGHPECR
jgi:hypothetical protein